MKPIDIIVLVAVILVVLLIIGVYIYKRVNNIPTGECACCSTKRGLDRMVKNVKKELDNERESCCCGKKAS